MARKALLDKQQERVKKIKYDVRKYTRCLQCGRSKSVFRDFGLCRICLRHFILEGKVPGVRKSSW